MQMNSLNSDNNEPPCAELKSDSGHQIRIISRGYEYRDEKEGWDADWQVFDLSVRVPNFLGQMKGVFFTGREIHDLAGELDRFNKLKLKEVTFEPMEPCLVLEIKLGKRYQVFIKGYAEYPLSTGSKLSFDFETDLSHIVLFIQGLRSITMKYPTKR
jgi:hypothetical protein